MSDVSLPGLPLPARSPIAGVGLPADDRFALAESPAAARFVFRGEAAARARGSEAFGVELPAKLGEAGETNARAALWLGPDEWLLIAEGAHPGPLGSALEAQLRDAPHSLVDVSDRQIGLIVRGASAARALSAGCPLDLRLTHFPVRHGDADDLRQGRDRALAPRRGGVPRRGLAVVRALPGRGADRGGQGRAGGLGQPTFCGVEKREGRQKAAFPCVIFGFSVRRRRVSTSPFGNQPSPAPGSPEPSAPMSPARGQARPASRLGHRRIPFRYCSARQRSEC